MQHPIPESMHLPPIGGELYQGRLNLVHWAGAGNLWAHGGSALPRQVPNGFYTVGVPGVLVSDSIPIESIEQWETSFDRIVRQWMYVHGYRKEKQRGINSITPSGSWPPIMLQGAIVNDGGDLEALCASGSESMWEYGLVFIRAEGDPLSPTFTFSSHVARVGRPQ